MIRSSDSSLASAATRRATAVRRARGAIGRGAIVGLVVASCLVVGGVLGLRYLIRESVYAAAERHGVQLRRCSFDLGLRRVAVEGCQFELQTTGRFQGRLPDGLSVSGTLGRVEASLSGLSVQSVQVDGTRAQVVGAFDPRRLLDALRGASAPSASSDGLPLSVRDGSLRWERPGASARFALTGLSYDSRDGRHASELELGQGLRGRVTGERGRFQVRVGETGGPGATLEVSATPGDPPNARLALEMRRFPLRELEALGASLGDAARDWALDGRVSIDVPLGLSAKKPSGRLAVTLHGLELPAPRELAGLRFSEAPRIDARLAPSRSLRSVELQALVVSLGALELRGRGRIAIEAGAAPFDASLRGPLSCQAIVSSAAGAHGGSVLASLAQRIAQRALTGSVEVVLAVSGDVAALDETRSFASAGVGCGLRAGRLDGVELPAELLEQLPEEWRARIPRRIELPSVPELRLPQLHELKLPGLPSIPMLPGAVRNLDAPGSPAAADDEP